MKHIENGDIGTIVMLFYRRACIWAKMVNPNQSANLKYGENQLQKDGALNLGW